MSKANARKIACGLLADGLDMTRLSAAGRREIREAIETLLKLVEEAADGHR